MPAVTDRAGDPLIFGAVLVELAALTAMENTGSDAVVLPSLTEILMFENVPVAVGLPVSLPVDVLNVAHDGRPEIEYPNELPSASAPFGVKL